jgi:hypothetical protein
MLSCSEALNLWERNLLEGIIPTYRQGFNVGWSYRELYGEPRQNLETGKLEAPLEENASDNNAMSAICKCGNLAEILLCKCCHSDLVTDVQKSCKQHHS